MAGGLRLVSTVLCDDVLVNAADRLTLYSIFNDLYADAYPAEVVRMHVVATWLNDTDGDRQLVSRAAIVSADGELIGDAAASVAVRPRNYHSQVFRFRDLRFPAPGQYRVQVQEGAETIEDLPLLLTGPAPEGSVEKEEVAWEQP